jgi:hypothetical protein
MKKLILSALIALCPLAAFAQGGSEALPFVRMDMGASLTGTAGAAIASPEAGAWSAFHNAAAITTTDNQSSAGLQMHLYGDFPGGGAAFSMKPADKVGLAFGALYQSGDTIGDFRTSEWLVSAGAGFSITDALSIGANARYARQSLTSDVAYSGFSMDFSVMDKVTDAVSVIAGVSALGGKITSATGTQYSQPANAFAGAEFSLEAFDGVLRADAMAEYYFSGAYAAAAGASFTYQEKVTVRCGGRFASQWCVMPSQVAAGAGYSFGSISIDASFVHMSAQNIIALGIGYKFQ